MDFLNNVSCSYFACLPSVGIVHSDRMTTHGVYAVVKFVLVVPTENCVLVPGLQVLYTVWLDLTDRHFLSATGPRAAATV